MVISRQQISTNLRGGRLTDKYPSKDRRCSSAIANEVGVVGATPISERHPQRRVSPPRWLVLRATRLPTPIGNVRLASGRILQRRARLAPFPFKSAPRCADLASTVSVPQRIACRDMSRTRCTRQVTVNNSRERARLNQSPLSAAREPFKCLNPQPR